jgi:cellulose synthase/poly-beta-1,6-N-acetylglucosamine synthase-like glycosyltransferase/spore germination protein YaaH/peptidoglycan/xylan/chitin deacetylase (PgdA/CDA1 family)
LNWTISGGYYVFINNFWTTFNEQNLRLYRKLSAYMNSNTQQVFQTETASRWQRFKWGTRLLFFFIAIGIAVFIITFSRGATPSMPKLIGDQEKQALLDTNSTSLFSKTKIGKQYGGFRKYINEKEMYSRGAYPIPKRFKRKNGVLVHADPDFYSFHKFGAGIRAAFYVDWDAQSYSSLEKNISHLNMVVPEWLFIDPTGDTIISKIDTAAYNIMRKAGVKIIPILSNNVNQVFHGDAVHRIITNPAKKEKLFNDLIHILDSNKLSGVNVDFEDLVEKKNETLVQFQKELYEKLHAKGYLVTQDVMPFNEDYNFVELAKYNDYIFLMAYDEHSESTGPGSIAEQKWIEGAVDETAKKIPSEKLILAIAGFGYDWRLDKHGKPDHVSPITYQQVLVRARTYQSKIDFDNDSYNLHFNYTDDNGADHEVYFTDAATSFNSLRFADEYGLSGVSLWRLGAEDSRMWDFYDRDMSRDSIKHFDFASFAYISSLINEETPDYEGNGGEILDIVGGPTSGRIVPEIDTAEMLISEESYDSLPSKWVAKTYGGDTANRKKLVLTFDDGPDPKYTPQILDILSQERVPATFFLVGLNAENNIPIVKRIYREGHEIGNHTFTHPDVSKISHKRAILEMEATRLLIECITGHSTTMFRAPFNADFQPRKFEELIPVAWAHEKNYLDIGESIDPEDWQPGTPADSIYNRVVAQKKRLTENEISGNIILLHDAGGDSRKATVEALPRIIQYFKKQGYTFTTVANLLGKKKDDMMPEVPRGSGYYLIQFESFLFEAGYWGGHILSSLFIVFIILSLARILLMALLAAIQQRKDKQENIAPFWLSGKTTAPLVSIIVPAYNEEVNAVSSLNNLLKTDYPNFEIIFVDDGSKDSTYEKVNAAFKSNPRVRVLTKPNGGKASALNYGIAQSASAHVVCIDADTKLLPNAVSLLMRHFDPAAASPDGPVGAVAGNVKVGNEINAITRWQAIEYITSQNFDRKAFSAVNAITVVPGAIGAFRKKALEDAGGFTTDTLAEDCDLTVRILRCGYVVKNDNKAIALTEAPETVRMFLKQRFRWSFGVMQTFYKNRDALFNWKYKWLGWIALPNILVFQFIIPTIAPLADIFMIIGIWSGNGEKILSYYFIFMLVDAAVSILAFSYEKEKLGKLVWLIPQRFIYRWLMYYVLFKSFRKAIKGELQHWGVLKRTGNVKDVVAV